MKTELNNIESVILQFGKNLTMSFLMKSGYNSFLPSDYENYYINLYNRDMKNNTISLHN